MNYLSFVSLGIVAIFMSNGLAMDLSKKGDDKAGERYHSTSLSVWWERAKAVNVLTSSGAQMEKYGSRELSFDLQSIVEQFRPEEIEGVTFRQMNDITRKKLETYGVHSFGSNDLFGRRTVWLNDTFLARQSKEVQEYLVACGLEETKLMNPDLKLMLKSEAFVGLASYSCFALANLTQAKMLEQKVVTQKSYDSLVSLMTWEDNSLKRGLGLMTKKRLRPGVFKAFGWVTAFTGPLIVVPNSSLEKNIVRNHKLDGIESASYSEQGLRKIKFAHDALSLSASENSRALPDDELSFMADLIEQREKAQERNKGNYYLCVQRCNDHLYECKDLNLGLLPKEVSLCSFEKKKCLKECSGIAQRSSTLIKKD